MIGVIVYFFVKRKENKSFLGAIYAFCFFFSYAFCVYDSVKYFIGVYQGQVDISLIKICSKLVHF